MTILIGVLFLSVTTVVASIFDTILPTVAPIITSDPWQCATERFSTYFEMPTPTGNLLDALISYGDEIQKDCQPTMTDALGDHICTFPPHSKLCSFTDVAPTTLLSTYSSYGSAASSWWAKHSASAVEHARYCPNKWFNAMTWAVYGAIWLNDTIAFAGCYAGAYPTSVLQNTTSSTFTAAPEVAPTVLASTTESETPTFLTSIAESEATPSETNAPAATDESNGVTGRVDSKLGMSVSTVLAVTILNEVV